MGMELVNWLITRGAKKILISSRQGVTKGSQQLRLNKWKCLGVNVIVSQLDISVESEAAKLLDEAKALGIVDGIFNVAGVFSCLINSFILKNSFSDQIIHYLQFSSRY